jgi:hypothetical protein
MFQGGKQDKRNERKPGEFFNEGRGRGANKTTRHINYYYLPVEDEKETRVSACVTMQK